MNIFDKEKTKRRRRLIKMYRMGDNLIALYNTDDEFRRDLGSIGASYRVVDISLDRANDLAVVVFAQRDDNTIVDKISMEGA